MNNKDLYDLFERLYFFECDRKEKIFSRFTIPFAAIGAMVGYYSLVIGLPWGRLPWGGQALFWSVLFFSVGCTLIATFAFMLALLGRWDEAIPTANDIERYRQELTEHYSPYDDSESHIANQLELVVTRYYMKSSSVLTFNNDWKVVRLYYCNLLLFFSAFSGLFCFILIKMFT